MLWPWHLRRAAWLLSLCLLTHCHLHVAAPLSLGDEAQPGGGSPKAQDVPANEIQVRSLPKTGPGTANRQDTEEDFFQDIDPKALATLLLQALNIQPEKSSKRQLSLEPSINEERFQSETKSSDVLPERQLGQLASEDGDRPPEETVENTKGRNFDQQEMESLKAMLEELQRYSPPTKREEDDHSQDQQAAKSEEAPDSSSSNDVLKELDEYEQLRVNTKRTALPSEPWAGARKLRQQQHLEHQLLQRRYEELAESRRQAEEARRAAAEEERLADMASDLLLQYLLKDGEEEGATSQGGAEEDGRKGSSLLFEDEESNVAEDKRSNEAPENEDSDDEEDIDPSTIDRLIELSSKLHLPADDVIDIINDVEKKKKEEEEEDVPEPSTKSKPLVAPPRNTPKKVPSYTTYQHQDPRPIPKSYYPPVYQPYRSLPKEDEAAWNEVLRGDEYLAPKWYTAKPINNHISNYISPRTFQPLAYHHHHHHHHHLPGPMVPRDEYYTNGKRVHDEELENYLERAVMKRPKVFQ